MVEMAEVVRKQAWGRTYRIIICIYMHSIHRMFRKIGRNNRIDRVVYLYEAGWLAGEVYNKRYAYST
jgi:hypothetical protein